MEVYLRDVTQEDRDLLFQWANDDTVRKNSFSSDKILYENHCNWFDNMMKDEQCIQWILQVGEQSVGQIRLKLEGVNAEIGYSICVERRGEGFGKQILKLALQRVKKEFPTVKKLTAKVKSNNVASLRAFENNGYKVIYEQLELEVD